MKTTKDNIEYGLDRLVEDENGCLRYEDGKIVRDHITHTLWREMNDKKPEPDIEFLEQLFRQMDSWLGKQSVQNTPKKDVSESQQNQGVKSSDLDVQKDNVL